MLFPLYLLGWLCWLTTLALIELFFLRQIVWAYFLSSRRSSRLLACLGVWYLILFAFGFTVVVSSFRLGLKVVSIFNYLLDFFWIFLFTIILLRSIPSGLSSYFEEAFMLYYLFFWTICYNFDNRSASWLEDIIVAGFFGSGFVLLYYNLWIEATLKISSMLMDSCLSF